MIRWIALLLCLCLFPFAGAAKQLEVFPSAITLELKPTDFDQVESTQGFLQIRIDTRLLRGSRWRVSLELVLPLESAGRTFKAQALSWTAQPPFVSRNLLQNQRVIVGEGPIDGRTVEGRLVWRAGGGIPSAEQFRGRVMVILEELP
ncbi:MAG: hypothetical protein ACM3MN_03865 [Nitrospirota bacterium]